MVDPESALQSERYRNYLMSLARIQLARAGPVQKKIESADLVQDVLLQAHAARAQYRGTTPEEFAAWLRQIMAHRLADLQKHYGRGKRDAALEATFRDSLDASAAGMLSLATGRLPTPTTNLEDNAYKGPYVRSTNLQRMSPLRPDSAGPVGRWPLRS